MTAVRIHRINFFKPEAKEITCISYDQFSSRLAVARSDFSIEIYDIREKPFLERVILGFQDGSIEALVWYDGRLFSAGLNGCIVEYDLLTLLPKYRLFVGAGCGVWCLAINKQKTHLAAGTEDGRICIFNISSDGVDFEYSFDRQEGRVICIAWHNSGDVIVTGSIDCIRIWDVKTGSTVDRIIIGRGELQKETFVWCIAVTSDMTIISGDSRGKTCFWDGRTGTLLSSSPSHKSDVLTLCVHEDEKTVYSSGVDHVIVKHVLSDVSANGKKFKWMRSAKNILHSHDVRSLQLAGETVVSGGVDTKLVFMNYPPLTVIKLCPFSEVGYCSVASDVSCVLFRYPHEIQVWKLGDTNRISGFNNEKLPLTSSPLKVISLQAKETERIVCSAISRDGRWLAYSSAQRLCLFQLNIDGKLTSIKKVKNLPIKNAAASVAFSSCGSRLIFSDSNGALQILECDLKSPNLLAIFKPNTDTIERRHLLAVCDGFVASADHSSNIHIYNLKTLSIHCSLPKYKVQPTAMEFDTKCEKLVVAYSDRMILEYAVQEKSTKVLLTKLRNDYDHPITGITFSPENHPMFHDENAIYTINYAKNEPSESENKCIDIVREENTYKRHDKFNHLLSFKRLRDDLMIVVEIPPECIIRELPGSLYRKRFGM